MTPRQASARYWHGCGRWPSSATSAWQCGGLRAACHPRRPAAQPTASAPTAPRSNANTASIAWPSRIGLRHNGGVHDDPGTGAKHELPRHLPEVRRISPEIVSDRQQVLPDASSHAPSRAALDSRKGHEQVVQSLQCLGPCSGRAASADISLSTRTSCAPRGHKLVGDRCLVTVAVQEGDTVRREPQRQSSAG